MMNSQGQSDGGIVPKKSSNNPVKTEAERMEGRPPAKGKADQSSMPRTQGRKPGMSVTLTRLREAEKRDKKAKICQSYPNQRFA